MCASLHDMLLNGLDFVKTDCLNLLTRYSFSFGIFSSTGGYGITEGRLFDWCWMALTLSGTSSKGNGNNSGSILTLIQNSQLK